MKAGLSSEFGRVASRLQLTLRYASDVTHMDMYDYERAGAGRPDCDHPGWCIIFNQRTDDARRAYTAGPATPTNMYRDLERAPRVRERTADVDCSGGRGVNKATQRGAARRRYESLESREQRAECEPARRYRLYRLSTHIAHVPPTASRHSQTTRSGSQGHGLMAGSPPPSRIGNAPPRGSCPGYSCTT